MISPPSRIVAAVESFKASLTREFGARVRRLVLFGSAARGEARWDSDVDVLVLLDCVDGHVDWREARRIIDLGADELTERDVLLSPTILSEEAFAALEASGRRLAREIAREGIPL